MQLSSGYLFVAFVFLPWLPLVVALDLERILSFVPSLGTPLRPWELFVLAETLAINQNEFLHKRTVEIFHTPRLVL